MDTYQKYLMNSIDIKLFELEMEESIINPQFNSLKKWIKTYLGPATAQYHNIITGEHSAIKVENRNAIIPSLTTEINGKTFYFSVKGCGAYEDMYYGGELLPSGIKLACRNPSSLPKIDRLKTGLGFIMGETWMGEAPYGAYGEENAMNELNVSKLAKFDSINGAHICPIIGITKLPKKIEEAARDFFWFREHPERFYQVLRLVPSNVRLYFESEDVMTDPRYIFSLFGIDSEKQVEKFELNFIKSGAALLTLYSRTVKRENDQISGLVYQDVWFDKDCVVAPDGTIHFADLEGLRWKTEPLKDYAEIALYEWERLAFEFLWALIRIDTYRLQLEERKLDWPKQREELALLVHLALSKDVYAHPEQKDGKLNIIVEVPSFPQVKIPLLEKVKP
jgi:hypothetical protein